MKRLLTFLLMVVALPAWLAADDNLPMPKEDVRTIRDIQSRVFGSPTLSTTAPMGEDLLALAELGSSSSSSAMQSSDDDALFALLQRYRDELLKMGLDATELDTEIKNLQVRANELQDRLDKLKPKDGLKIDGRIYSGFDDLQLLGNKEINAIGLTPKPAGQGLDYELGVVHSELQLTFTRGPFFGYVQFDTVSPWGLTYGSAAPRKVYLEMRLPIVIQVGNVDAGITPLTLWRNDDYEPFEPEPFSDRRQRLEDDLLLVPNKWTVTGTRATTDAVLFGVQHLQLEDVLAVMGNPAGEISGVPPVVYVEADGTTLTTRYGTYMNAWRAALPFINNHLTLSDNGVLFWDNTSTSPATPAFTSMNELVQSFRADFKAGIFKADFEYALSSYTAPELTTMTAAGAMTGTAMTYAAGIQTDAGHLKVFGRTVSNSFNNAGAQGRTQDNSYAFLGPFPTENLQLGANGTVGIDPNIPTSFATRFNNVLIPPGTYSTATPNATPSAWQHLLAYDVTENIDPYGEATPNRTGFGADGDWKFFNGVLRPIASYEQFSEIDNVIDINNGNALTSPFTMSRLRAGLDLDAKPMVGWPLRIGFGYTSTNNSNGDKTPSGETYSLATTQLDGGIEYDFTDSVGVNFGYRHMDADGLNETFNIISGGEVWDLFGYGLWWKPMDTLRFDAVYSQEYETAASVTGYELEVDEALLRLTLSF